MVWPILISVSVMPGALPAHAGRKPWEEYAAAAAADCNRKRRVIMSFLLDAFVGFRARLAKSSQCGVCLKPKAHYCGRCCDADHTLLRFAVHPFRIEACPSQAAASALERHCQAAGPSTPLAARRSRAKRPSGSVAWAESSHS